MVKYQFENLKEFFERVKKVGFIERLFFWKNVVSLSYDAYEEFKSVDKKLESINEDLRKANSRIESLENDQGHLKEIKINLQAEKKSLEQKKDDLTKEITQLEKKVTGFEKVEEKKQNEYEEKLAKFDAAKEHLDEERNRIREEKEKEDEEHREKVKRIWKEHEDKVKEVMKTICSRHNVEYINKVPFKGSPDNTIKICGEHIIFDAKSPRSEDLTNFSTYIKTQAESAKKYAKIKDVKKDIFLVIPTNAVDSINKTFFNQVDYSVHVVTIDALEPIILSLQKIEDYEFAEQLSPDDREHICRIIGKFAHATKRRIQVDHFFADTFMDIFKSCDSLPKDILDGAVVAEKSGLLNPTQEKRAKVIETDDLKKSNKRIKKEAEAKDINTKSKLDVIETVPLYTED